jgi:hypothetical protein
MGRPLNKNKLAGLVAIYNNGVELTGSRIIKQKGSKRFLLDDGNVYKMVGVDDNNLTSGEMVLHAHLPDGTVTTVSKISSRKATLANGTVVTWIASVNQVEPAPGAAWIESYEFWIAS